MLRCMGGGSSEVFRVIDESGLTFSQMKVLVELETADEDERTVTALSEELGISPRPPAVPPTGWCGRSSPPGSRIPMTVGSVAWR